MSEKATIFQNVAFLAGVTLPALGFGWLLRMLGEKGAKGRD